MKDMIERQAALDALESIGSLDTEADRKYARSIFEALPSVQPEAAIPITWLEKHIEWLRSFDNDVATFTAGNIIGTIAKWRSEQDENR